MSIPTISPNGKPFENVPCKYPSLQLPGMALQLIPMRIDTAKEIRTTMHIEHDPPAALIRALSGTIVALHLDPLRLEILHGAPPLPPGRTPDSHDAPRAQLLGDLLRGLREVLLWDGYLFDPHPSWRGDPLRREVLQVLDGVVRGMLQKRADHVETLIIGHMGGRLVAPRLPIGVLLAVVRELTR